MKKSAIDFDSETVEKYRFDDAYGIVYQYNETIQAYLSECTYFAAGIRPQDSKPAKIRKMENRQ